MSRYWLYYAGYDQATGLEQIGLAVSHDLKVWKRPSQHPIVPVGSAGDADVVQTSNPFVLKEGNLFRMWYQGKSTSGRLSICYAESHDGIAWNFFPSLAFSHKEESSGEYREGYHHPHVLKDPQTGIYRMWFSFQRGGIATIACAESVDGKQWEVKNEKVLTPELPWEGSALYYPYVRKLASGTYELWYTGRAAGGSWITGRATSDDGESWKKDTTGRLLPRSLGAPTIRRILGWLRLGSRTLNGVASPYLFDYQGITAMLTHDVGPRGRLSIGFYTSSNGTNWKHMKANVLQEGSSAWDSYFQADPFLLTHE